MIADLHGIPRCVGGGEHVAGLDRPIGCVRPHIDAAAEGYVLSPFNGTFLLESDAWVNAIGAADDAGHSLIVGEGAALQPSRVFFVDHHHGPFLQLFFPNLKWLGHICSAGDGENFRAGSTVDVELGCWANRAYTDVAGIADGKVVGRRARRRAGITGRAKDGKETIGVTHPEPLSGTVCLPADCFPIC